MCIRDRCLDRGEEGIYFRADGDIDIDVDTGDFKIITLGDCESCTGIWAYSESDGAVTVTMTGDITTSGNDSEGILAQSNSGDIGITLHGGTITSAKFPGVRIVNGDDNRLAIYDEVTISGGTYDILGGDDNEAIDNYGTLTALGDINLGGGSNAFDNHAGATFNSGATVYLLSLIHISEPTRPY